MMWRLLTIGLLVFSLTSCDSRKEGIEGSIDRVGEDMRTTVHFHENRVDLKLAYAEVHDIKPHEVPAGLEGFAVWYEWKNKKPENAENECTIHTVEPRRVDDTNTLTLGHEMLHCLYGSYH